jgi:hypothetical protein
MGVETTVKSEILEGHLRTWSIVYVLLTYLGAVAFTVFTDNFISIYVREQKGLGDALMVIIGLFYLLLMWAVIFYNKIKVKCELSKSLKNKDL